MFKRILLAVDGSEASQKAVDWAIASYGDLPQALYTILYIHEPFYASVPEAMGYLPQTTDMPDVTASFEAWKQFPDQERVTFQNVLGNPAKMICEEAKVGGYDVVALGSKGHGVVSSILLGSVTASVLQHAPCSVLVIR